jgi:hypothetical protein
MGEGGVAAAAPAALSKDLSDFLIEFSIGVHRYAMYPPGHPSLEPAAENLITRLSTLLRDRRTMNIGVANRQLIIEGVATDEKHPVLSDLARRLHAHQIAAVSFAMGTRMREVEGMLKVLADEPDPDEDPIGLLPRDQIPTWDHIQLYPVGYDRLAMMEGETAAQARATELWLSLSQAALATSDPLDMDSAPDGEVVAHTIDAHKREGAYDQVIVGYMLQLAEELKGDTSGQADSVRRQMSALVRELDPSTLVRMVNMGGSAAQRRKFVLDANQGMAVESVVKVLEAAAETEGQNITTSMTRMLSKLAIHAEKGATRARAEADTALREHVEELIADWELEDPNPDQYTLVLDSLARTGAAPPTLTEHGQDLRAGFGEAEAGDGAIRLVQMALEVGAYGPTVEAALIQIVQLGLVTRVLPLLEEVEEESAVARQIREQLTRPEQLDAMLAGDDVDERALADLVKAVGGEAIRPMFDALLESESRRVRRKVFDVLSKMGPRIWREAADRLADPRWYVKRNMLALLKFADPLPAGVPLRGLLSDRDPRVRREAFPLAMKAPDTRERALAEALRDRDERLVRMALLEMHEGLPETLVPTVVNRILATPELEDLHPMALRALGASTSNLAVEGVIGVCTDGKSMLGRVRIAETSQRMLTALAVLHFHWKDDARVQPVLARALDSKDPAVRSAASGGRKL